MKLKNIFNSVVQFLTLYFGKFRKVNQADGGLVLFVNSLVEEQI